MLANIIATIMMALGVATGNVSSNVYKGGNAFYDEEHTKPIQKVNDQQTEFFYETQLTNIQSIGNPSTESSTKYYIGNTNTPNKSTVYCNVYNSVYVYTDNTTNSSGYHMLRIASVMRIDNYTDFNMTDIYVNTNYTIETWVQSNYYDNLLYRLENADNLIDRTITTTTSAQDIWSEIYNYSSKTLLNQNSGDNTSNVQGSNNVYYGTIGIGATIELIPAHSNIIIAELATALVDSRGTITLGNPNNNEEGAWIIRGYPTIQNVNYEVIDVPNVMYTILTMPFSFISTAFNLTIFPGTPYALNFGNLFLTIVAIFILLWIIKKVFH